MLLLGGANVGKSTIFKQMRLLHCSGFSDADKRWAKGCIIENILQTMNELASVVDSGEDNDDQLMEDSDEVYKFLLSFRLRDADGDVEPPAVPPETWSIVKRMWADERVKEVFNTGSVKLLDSAGYVLSNIERISAPDYVPTNDDMLRLRRATSGSMQLEFDTTVPSMTDPKATMDMHVNVFDVGGHAHEQTEWEKHANNLDAIVYICALSEYDTERSEDKKNLLQSQMDTLKEICDSDCFRDATILILLNKTDLLEEKLARAREGHAPSVRHKFKSYRGKDNKEDVVDFFKGQVKKLVLAGEKNCTGNMPASTLDRVIIETCAIDTALMENVLQSLFGATMIQALAGLGMVSME